MRDEDENAPFNIDRIIHEPARLQIMTHLYVVEEADFLFLMRKTGLTWGNLSSHMTKLEQSGYIEIKKEFLDKKPHTILKLTSLGRTAFEKYRTSIERILENISD